MDTTHRWRALGTHLTICQTALITQTL